MLFAKDITLFKQGRLILTANKLSVSLGEIGCIVGKNGAGKSTLLRALVGLEMLESGTVVYNNINMLSPDRYYALWELGIMLTSDSYYEYLTCQQNLEIVQRYYGQTRFSIDQVIDLFGLTNYRKQKLNRLSSGTKQRLSLAITFINCPSLVILDEPFNSIDRENTRQIVKLIHQLNSEYNTAFIITSHSFEDVEKLYSVLFVLREGHIACQLTRSEIEQMIFLKVRHENLSMAYEELTALFPTAQLDDEGYIVLTANTVQQADALATIMPSVEQQRQATPKDIYEIFG